MDRLHRQVQDDFLGLLPGVDREFTAVGGAGQYCVGMRALELDRFAADVERRDFPADKETYDADRTHDRSVASATV